MQGITVLSQQPFAPVKIGGDGEHKLRKDKPLLRYRFIFHKGPAKDANKCFTEYAKDDVVIQL